MWSQEIGVPCWERPLNEPTFPFAPRRVFLHPARRRTRPLSPGAGRGSPDTMAVSGAWPQPKIRPTLLLLLVASASAQTPPEPKDASPGTSEKSRHIGTGPETTSPCAEIASNSTEPCAELTRNSPDLSAELTRNNSDLSAELASNSTEPSAELASNSTEPSAELASNSTEPSAELASNSTEPSAELTSNSTEPSAELTSNSTEPSVRLALDPPTAAQQIPTTARTLATEEPVGSVSPSALPATEAAGALSSGGEKPVTELKREGLKGPTGTVPGSPGPGQENQTVPAAGAGRARPHPTEPAKAEGADRSGHNRTVPTSADRPRHYGTTPDHSDWPGADQTTPKLSPSIPPAKNQKPDPKVALTPAAPASSPAPYTRSPPVGIIVAVVIVAFLALVVLAMFLHCRHQRRSGSTSFSGGRAGPGEWAGPVSLPEERGEGPAGDGGQQAGAGEGRRPTLTTFFGKRHSRVSSVAMEDVAGPKGEGPLSEPLLATAEQGGDPAPPGVGARPGLE
uniref:Uncharacterized protein n=1 Tax=Chelydra serpentina TaxID=8475 RepID=A0A8C3SEY5_CHESE